MKIRINTLVEIRDSILNANKQIIIYGAGMIGSVTTLSILEELGIEKNIDFFCDGDPRKWGTSISDFPVYRKEKLKEISAQKHVLLIAISRFYDVLEELDKYDNLHDIDCWIIPMICIECYRPSNVYFNVKQSHIQQIPKVIHYMWLGHEKMPPKLQKCIDSWERFCPDYEIKKWDENNYNIEKISYMKQAYESNAYGFVPDYARLDILYNHGGIYLDTDVELVRSLDDLLYQEAFCCVEKWQTINFGGGSGSRPQNELIGALLKEREEIGFINSDGILNKNTCGYYDTKFFMKNGYKINGKLQRINGVTVYPYEVFHPYDYMSGKIEKTTNTYGIHHFNGGWLDESQLEANILTVQCYDDLYKRAKR